MAELTDIQKLEKILTEIGCEYKISILDKIETVSNHNYEREKINVDTLLRIEEGFGYSNFYIEFYFLNGKYQKHGCFE